MFSTLNDQKKSLAENRLVEIMEEITHLNNDISSTTDSQQKIRLKRKLAELYKEGEQKEAEIEKLTKFTKGLHNSKFHWTDKLHKINFKDAVERIDSFTDTLNNELAISLLIQNSMIMGGNWCISRIIEILKERTSDFKRYPIEITVGNSWDEKGILNSLGNYFGLDFEDNLTQLTERLIDQIIKSLQSGSILLFEIKGLELSNRSHEIIYHILTEFWENLLHNTKRKSTHYRKIKLIIFFITDDNLLLSKLLEFEQTVKNKLVNDKIFELPLVNWNKVEISDWLDYHSGLTIQEVEILSKTIFESTKGLPALVYQSFSNYLEPRKDL